MPTQIYLLNNLSNFAKKKKNQVRVGTTDNSSFCPFVHLQMGCLLCYNYNGSQIITKKQKLEIGQKILPTHSTYAMRGRGDVTSIPYLY